MKFIIIAPSSFLMVVAIYEFLIRRINVMRFLFGMGPRVAIELPAPTESTPPTFNATPSR